METGSMSHLFRDDFGLQDGTVSQRTVGVIFVQTMDGRGASVIMSSSFGLSINLDLAETKRNLFAAINYACR